MERGHIRLDIYCLITMYGCAVRLGRITNILVAQYRPLQPKDFESRRDNHAISVSLLLHVNILCVHNTLKLPRDRYNVRGMWKNPAYRLVFWHNHSIKSGRVRRFKLPYKPTKVLSRKSFPTHRYVFNLYAPHSQNLFSIYSVIRA